MDYINIIDENDSIPIRKGSKILSLNECYAENTLKAYKVNSYLINLYKFYFINGYNPYTSIDDFIIDFKNNSNDCIIRTFMTVSATLKKCSKCPFFKNTDRYTYSCLEEQDLIEEIIEETYYQVFGELRNTLDINMLLSLSTLKTYIKKGIKGKAHLNRHIKKYNIEKPYDTKTLENLAKSYNIEDDYIKKDTQKIVRNLIKTYINTKDKIDTLILVKNLMRHGIPYGETENCRFSLKYIAALCNVSERTVKSRSKKLIAELKPLFADEILSLTEPSFI
jgi:hypothetical protein